MICNPYQCESNKPLKDMLKPKADKKEGKIKREKRKY